MTFETDDLSHPRLARGLRHAVAARLTCAARWRSKVAGHAVAAPQTRAARWRSEVARPAMAAG
jgi:hypothetical protein